MTYAPTGAAAASPQTWTPEWSNPVFSLAERDRRWASVRRLMARDGVDVIICLPCTNSHNRGQADARYLTQLGENSDESTVAFPITGPVTAWHSRSGVWPSSNWFEDIRAAGRGTGGATIVKWLNENAQYTKGRIAISGLTSNVLAHCRSDEGEVNWQSVETLKRSFPNAEFVSASDVLGEARWVKSDEEIDFIRRGVEVAEISLQALQNTAGVGVPERSVFAAMLHANAIAGGSFTPMIGWVTGVQGAPYHRVEQPTLRSFASGDVISVEIEGRWAGHIAQIDQTSVISTATSETKAAAELCCDVFQQTLQLMKPGTTIGELADQAVVTALGGRLRAGLGLHGRGTGDDGPLVVSSRQLPPSIRDLPLLDGCSFALKPSVTGEGGGEYFRWGDSVVVRRNGGERLGSREPGLLVI